MHKKNADTGPAARRGICDAKEGGLRHEQASLQPEWRKSVFAFRRPPGRPRWEPEVQFLGNHAIVCNYSIPERGSGVKPQAQIGRSWRGLRACG